MKSPLHLQARHRIRSSARPLPRLLAAGVLALTPVAARAQESAPAAPAPLFRTAGVSAGNALAPGSAAYVRAQLAGEKPEGRVTPLDRASFAAIATIRAEAHVLLPLADGESVEAVVNLTRREADDTLRVSGTLYEAQTGTFLFSVRGEEVSGFILRRGAGVAYRVEGAAGAPLVLREVPLNDLVCGDLPRKVAPARAPSDQPPEAVPLLNSRPGTVAQLYLDFDGEVVTDPSWNGGQTINAASYNLSAADISAIFGRVKEDFWPFNINVTTDLAKYNAAPVGKRMRCIITPNDDAAPGYGGVAYYNSFARAGSSFSSTIPCWVFNSDVVGISEAISHELGHTFGLHHDGREIPGTGHEEYYYGQGSGATSWCPIMGAGYYVNVVQWSKGEYQYANNQEDDLAIIGNSANGFGLVADEAGNSRDTATVLTRTGSTVSQSGVVTSAADADFFSFNMGAGSLTINAVSASASPDLDIALEVQNAAGTTVLTSNPPGALNASVTGNLVAGTYYLKVSGSGTADPSTTGYTSYGSIGSYLLSGTVPPAPVSRFTKADLNADGFGDLIWQNTVTGEHVAWFLRNGVYQSGPYLPTIDPAWTIAATADFNGDGFSDFVWQNLSTGERVIWLCRNGQYTGGVYLPTIPAEWRIAGAADVDGDGFADLVWQNARTGQRDVWLMRNGQLTTVYSIATIPPEWQIAAVGDVDGDGLADLVWQNARTGQRDVWLLKAGGRQVTAVYKVADIAPAWTIAGSGDFNNDGYADLAWQNLSTGERVIWFCKNGYYQSGVYLPTVDPAWQIVNH